MTNNSNKKLKLFLYGLLLFCIGFVCGFYTFGRMLFNTIV